MKWKRGEQCLGGVLASAAHEPIPELCSSRSHPENSQFHLMEGIGQRHRVKFLFVFLWRPICEQSPGPRLVEDLDGVGALHDLRRFINVRELQCLSGPRLDDDCTPVQSPPPHFVREQVWLSSM